MGDTPYSPTVRRLRLAGELRRLRRAAGMTVTQAARLAGLVPSKLTRLERAESERPKPADVAALLDLYGVADPLCRDAMLALARDTRMVGWWRRYRGVFRGVLPDLEVGASEIRTFEAVHIPGLLQTPGYAAAVLRVGLPDDAALARRVAARMARQEILDRVEPPAVHAVIDEAALRKRVGGAVVMREQLLHLVAAAARPHISIQVVTDETGAHPGMNAVSFVLLRFPCGEDPRIVFLESAETSLCLESGSDVARYEQIFGRLRAAALPASDSVEFVSDLASRIMMEGGEDD